ncbi:MAG TPA: response regulator [Polyangiales bacterium]
MLCLPFRNGGEPVSREQSAPRSRGDPRRNDGATLRRGSHHGIYELRRAFRSSIFLDTDDPVRGRVVAKGVFMTEGSAGGSVLVVDDEEALVRGVQRVLARAGFSVDAVSNGQEAVALLEQKVFDCIVSDINMPGLLQGYLFAKPGKPFPEARWG